MQDAFFIKTLSSQTKSFSKLLFKDYTKVYLQISDFFRTFAR